MTAKPCPKCDNTAFDSFGGCIICAYKHLSNKGQKFDAEKRRWDLLPWDALEQVVLVLEFGAKKYGERNWEDGIKGWEIRFPTAILRHTIAVLRGEWIDPESKLPHMAHVGCTALFVIAGKLRKLP